MLRFPPGSIGVLLKMSEWRMKDVMHQCLHFLDISTALIVHHRYIKMNHIVNVNMASIQSSESCQLFLSCFIDKIYIQKLLKNTCKNDTVVNVVRTVEKLKMRGF